MISTCICATCNEKEAKYKCPSCRSPYCSVSCCKVHKEGSSCQSQASNPTLTQQQQLSPRTMHSLSFQTDDTVAPEKLSLLGESPDLRAMLGNPHLQALLRTVDCAPNASSVMEAAMQEPIFLEFTDLCLRLIQPPQQPVMTDEQLIHRLI